jgi:hypothetical protein
MDDLRVVGTRPSHQGGPGAFWILASDYEDYERAMRAKLLRELMAPLVSGWPVAEPKKLRQH